MHYFLLIKINFPIIFNFEFLILNYFIPKAFGMISFEVVQRVIFHLIIRENPLNLRNPRSIFSGKYYFLDNLTAVIVN